MKINIKNYLLYSSVFAIFTESFFFNFIIDWKLLYLIIFVNYALLFKIKKVVLPKYFAYLLLFFLVHGLLTYTIIWIPYNFMISQILGIAIIGTYFYNVLSLYKPKEVIDVYLKMSFWTAAIGFIIYFLKIPIGNEGEFRFHSFFKEPAHYVIVVLPACYYYLKMKNYWRFVVIFVSLILSSSSLGYIGCGLMFLLPNLTLKRLGYFLATVPILIVTFVFVYSNFEFFRMRVDETYSSLKVINTGKFDPMINLSSYVLISNIYIAKENVIDHPLGSGIGSHHYMHTQRYLKDLRVPEYIRKQGKHTDNSFDANSLFTRIFSEFGFIGFFLVIFGMYKASKCYSDKNLLFAQGVFIYFLLKLFRDGHYFPPELFFFIWVFYFSFKEEQNLIDSKS